MTVEDILKEIDEATDEQNIFFRPVGKHGIDLGFYNGVYRVVIHQPGDWHDQVVSIVSSDKQLIAEETVRLLVKYASLV